ncbi:Proline rich extensin signature [Sesbania bispinosa]|nr:Proline rich extensin signature [Sesbania bispinosa]
MHRDPLLSFIQGKPPNSHISLILSILPKHKELSEKKLSQSSSPLHPPPIPQPHRRHRPPPSPPPHRLIFPIVLPPSPPPHLPHRPPLHRRLIFPIVLPPSPPPDHLPHRPPPSPPASFPPPSPDVVPLPSQAHAWIGKRRSCFCK